MVIFKIIELNSDNSEENEVVGSEYYIFICVNIWQNVMTVSYFIVLNLFSFHSYYLLYIINLCFLVFVLKLSLTIKNHEVSQIRKYEIYNTNILNK